MTLTNYMCQEKKEEEDLPALKTVLTHRLQQVKECIEKNGGRGLTSIEDSVDTSIQQVKECIEKNLHPRNDVDRLYVSRKEGGRGLTSIEDSVDTSIQQVKDCIEKNGGRIITTTRNKTENMRSNRMEITRKLKWEEKLLYGCFK